MDATPVEIALVQALAHDPHLASLVDVVPHAETPTLQDMLTLDRSIQDLGASLDFQPLLACR